MCVLRSEYTNNFCYYLLCLQLLIGNVHSESTASSFDKAARVRAASVFNGAVPLLVMPGGE